MQVPKTERASGHKSISTFFQHNPVATKEHLSQATSLSVKTIEANVGKRLLTSLNADHRYLTLKGKVARGHDRQGFLRPTLANGEVAVFHIKGDAVSTLRYLARTIPWGLTQAEAAKLLGRECPRPLNALVEEGHLKRVMLNGIWIYTHPWPTKAALQLNHRRTNERVCPPPPKDEGEKPTVFLEEIMETFRDVVSGVETVPTAVPKGQLCSFLLMTITDITYRGDMLLLRTNDRIRKACGLETGEVLDHTTMCRIFNSGHLPESVLEDILKAMVDDLREMGVITGRYLVVDATHLFAWYNTSRDTDVYPLPGAAWGQHQGSFFGYKLHILIDAESELPVAARITPGNEHDSPSLMPLVKDFKEKYDAKEVLALFADGAYDDKDLRRGVEEELRCHLFAAINPRRSS